MSVREILERAQEDALGLDGDAEASVWRNACEEALATLYAETVREILSGGERTISPGGGMEQRPDWRPYLQESSAELIVLPRAAVEALRDECLNGQRKSIRATGYRIVDILAAAKPVVDAGVCRGRDAPHDTHGPGVVHASIGYRVVPERRTYRVLLIAADAAEEG